MGVRSYVSVGRGGLGVVGMVSVVGNRELSKLREGGGKTAKGSCTFSIVEFWLFSLSLSLCSRPIPNEGGRPAISANSGLTTPRHSWVQ